MPLKVKLYEKSWAINCLNGKYVSCLQSWESKFIGTVATRLQRGKSLLPRWINSPRRRATSSNLLVDVTAPRYVQRGPDAYAGPVQGSWAWFRNVAATVHLLVVDRVLIVVVGFQGQLGAADRALEAARVEEREVLQRADSVHLVHGLGTPQTRAFVKVRPIHRLPRSGGSCCFYVSVCWLVFYKSTPWDPESVRLSCQWKYIKPSTRKSTNFECSTRIIKISFTRIFSFDSRILND